MEVVALKRQNQFEYLTLTTREDVCVKIDKLMSVVATREQQSCSYSKQDLKNRNITPNKILAASIKYLVAYECVTTILTLYYP